MFLQSGGIAGTAVDVILFPLDTIKTRMQSADGFFKAGGFKRIYSGLGSAAAGSAPSGTLIELSPTYTKEMGKIRNCHPFLRVNL